MSIVIHELGAGDVAGLRAVNALFAGAFEDPVSYASRPPSDAYLARLLERDTFIALAATDGAATVGGLAPYVLEKFEQQRSEIYIYDLAVAATHRRQRIATALIERLRRIGAKRGAWVVYVQADYRDDPAIALYSKLGRREDVMHFDIEVEPRETAG
jgi:aminoglycoside 3-N-acetyltransferase I